MFPSVVNNSDSIFIYDFESLNNLNVNGTNALFTYYEEFIILHSEDKIIRYSLQDSSESLILDSSTGELFKKNGYKLNRLQSSRSNY